jgi:hypothetical protein
MITDQYVGYPWEEYNFSGPDVDFHVRSYLYFSIVQSKCWTAVDWCLQESGGAVDLDIVIKISKFIVGNKHPEESGVPG